MALREYAVERGSTEKLEGLLNSIYEKGREVSQVFFLGGRDWVVISYRDIKIPGEIEGSMFTSGFHDMTTMCVKENGAPAETHFDGLVYGKYDNSFEIEPNGAKRALGYKGWVEDVDRTWMLFIGPDNRPKQMFLQRDIDGGVLGLPVNFDDAPIPATGKKSR